MGDVCLWHLVDIPPGLTNVGFERKSGHDAGVTRYLLMTQSGHPPRVDMCAHTGLPLLARVTRGSLLIGGRHTFELDGSRWTARYLECRDDYVLAL